VVEIDRAVSAKLPHLVEKLRIFLRDLGPIMVEDPPEEKVLQAAQQMHMKDAPILAAAKDADVDFLVTLDKKHFLDAREEIEFDPPVLTPGEFLQEFEKWSQDRA
jgi:predicted nucleic acid-binding protein